MNNPHRNSSGMLQPRVYQPDKPKPSVASLLDETTRRELEQMALMMANKYLTLEQGTKTRAAEKAAEEAAAQQRHREQELKDLPKWMH